MKLSEKIAFEMLCKYRLHNKSRFLRPLTTDEHLQLINRILEVTDRGKLIGRLGRKLRLYAQRRQDAKRANFGYY